MIIWGSRGVTKVVESRDFHCPQCGTLQSGELKQVRNFFTLYFIPLIPLDVAGKYVECAACRGSYAEEIFDYDPAKEKEESLTQMLRIMIMAALADGEVDATERTEIQKQYMEIAGLPVPSEKLDKEIEMAVSSGTDLTSFAEMVSGDLSDRGKGLAVQVAYATMSAGGDLNPGHKDQFATFGTALGIPKEQYLELLKHLQETMD